MRTPSREEFLAHVAHHGMAVALDQGLHRQLTFKQPDTFNRHFHITTWPGYLAISGDMGSFVFSRLRDMFEFFRGSEINPQYWAEKIQADDRRGGHKVFSEEFYRNAVTRDFEQWVFDSPDQRARAWAEIETVLLDCMEFDHAGTVAIRNAMDYVCPVSKQSFVDFWDHNFHDYSYHFIWACRAIQWAIEQYDRSKATKRDAAA